MQNEDQNPGDVADEILLCTDVDVIRRSFQQIKEGQSMEASAFFDQVRSQLLEIKVAQAKGTA